MEMHRLGSSTSQSSSENAALTATLGKQTLLQAQQVAPASQSASPLVGGAGLAEGTAKLEGGTLLRSPDAALSTVVPSVATPDKTSDADYEKTMSIKAAIDNKTMLPVVGVNGQSFPVTGCAGKKDGKVSFTFERAFVGDYNGAAYGKAVRGAHVSISVALSGCGEHKDVKLVQVLRNTTKQDGKVVTADPGSAKLRERSGWNDDKAKSKGWRVDGLDSDTTPFYVTDDLYGDHGSDESPAKLRDSPGNWMTDRNVGKEFRTCAVSYKGGHGTVLACVDWGYYIDDTGAATFYPATPTAYVGAVQELTDAAERWDGMPGNTKANLVK